MIGIAPLMITKINKNRKRIEFITEEVSDYLDFILCRGYERKILELITGIDKRVKLPKQAFILGKSRLGGRAVLG